MRIAMVSEHASPLAAVGGVDAGGQNVHVLELGTWIRAGTRAPSGFTPWVRCSFWVSSASRRRSSPYRLRSSVNWGDRARIARAERICTRNSLIISARRVSTRNTTDSAQASPLEGPSTSANRVCQTHMRADTG